MLKNIWPWSKLKEYEDRINDLLEGNSDLMKEISVHPPVIYNTPATFDISSVEGPLKIAFEQVAEEMKPVVKEHIIRAIFEQSFSSDHRTRLDFWQQASLPVGEVSTYTIRISIPEFRRQMQLYVG